MIEIYGWHLQRAEVSYLDQLGLQMFKFEPISPLWMEKLKGLENIH